MRQQMMQDPDDVRWALDKVGMSDVQDMHCCALFGNEDAPDRLWFWRKQEPRVLDMPDIVWSAEK